MPRAIKKEMNSEMNKSRIGLGYIPPQDIGREKAVLGIILLESSAVHKVMDIIQPDTFYDPTHGLIWECILELAKENQPIDSITVSKQLKSKGTFSAGSDIRFTLTALTNDVVSSVNLTKYAMVIEEKAIARRTIMANLATNERLYHDDEDINVVLTDGDLSLFKARRSLVSTKNVSTKSIGQRALEQIKLGMTSGGIVGVPFGVPELDRKTGGMRPGRIYTWGARSRHGKTAIAAYCAYYAACNGEPSVFFSMEMGDTEFYFRLISLRCRELGYKIYYSDIDKGNVTPDELVIIERAIDDLSKIPIYIDDTSGLSPLSVKGKLLKYMNDYGVTSAWLDYIQIADNSGNGDKKTTADQISMAMTLYKGIAKDLPIPLNILSQIDRTVESNGQKGRPVLVNLKSSGALEEASDVVILVYRPEVFDPMPMDESGNDERGIMYLDVAKNKMGETGLVKIPFSIETNFLEEEKFEFKQIDKEPLRNSFTRASGKEDDAPF